MSLGADDMTHERSVEASLGTPLFGAVRRVVTGHDEQRKSVFVRDEQVAPISTALFGRIGIHWLYGADQLPDLPVKQSIPAHEMFFPPPGGFRFGFLNLPPKDDPVETEIDIQTALSELEAKLPGMASHADPNVPERHRTATVDALVVLSGTPTLELDDGATVELSPGDTVIQNGTWHRWINNGSSPATIAYFLCGVENDHLAQTAPGRD
jgi:mannose-6-phosphate isomerase-like protein (cupin superfamily)